MPPADSLHTISPIDNPGTFIVQVLIGIALYLWAKEEHGEEL